VRYDGASMSMLYMLIETGLLWEDDHDSVDDGCICLQIPGAFGVGVLDG